MGATDQPRDDSGRRATTGHAVDTPSVGGAARRRATSAPSGGRPRTGARANPSVSSRPRGFRRGLAPGDGPAFSGSSLRTPTRSSGYREAAEGVTWPVRVAAAWTWRLLAIGLGVYALVRIFSQVWLVVFSFILALFLTAVLHPLERQLRSVIHRFRSLPALLALLIGVAVLGSIGWFVSWQISTHATELGNQLSAVVNHANHWLRTGPLHLKSSDLNKITSKISDTIKQHPGTLISGAIATVRAVSEFLAAVFLILLSTFYLLRDGQLVWRWVVSLFPRAAHDRIDRAGTAGWRSFGGYMRGQLFIALIHGVTITILLLVLRVPLAGALGVLIFLGSFIPVLGLLVTGALPVAVTVLEHGLISGIIVAVAIIVLVQIEGHLLQPLIMSRTVNVHPLAIVLGVVAGTTLGGIPGAYVATPLIAFLNTTVRALHAPPAPPPTRPAAPHQAAD
jgi:putative heme transporter